MEIENPEKIIGSNGRPQFGFYPSTSPTINAKDFDFRSPLGRRYSSFKKKMGLKEFQFICLSSNDFIFGAAIADIKWASNSFYYFYDIKKKSLIEKSFIWPLGLKTFLTREPEKGKSYFKKGCFEIFIEAFGPEEGKRTLILKDGNQFKIEANLWRDSGYEPLRICSQTGKCGWTFTQKTPGVRAEGKIHLGNEEITFSSPDTLGSIDISCGHMRHETYWNWANFSGTLPSGEILGLNLARGVNETSMTENGLWVNGKLIKIDQALFEFDPDNLEGLWKIKSSDKKVDLEFKPFGNRTEKINLGFIASNFNQLFGKYSGFVRDEDGNLIEIKDLWGLAEDHYAKW